MNDDSKTPQLIDHTSLFAINLISTGIQRAETSANAGQKALGLLEGTVGVLAYGGIKVMSGVSHVADWTTDVAISKLHENGYTLTEGERQAIKMGGKFGLTWLGINWTL